MTDWADKKAEDVITYVDSDKDIKGWLADALREERERCAKIAMSYEPSCPEDDCGHLTAVFIANAIRGKDET